MAFDHYTTLGLSRNASKLDISRAFRDLAKQFHPDKNPGDTEALQRFKAISEAFTVLKDDAKRAVYDSKTFGRPWRGDASHPFSSHFRRTGATSVDEMLRQGEEVLRESEGIFREAEAYMRKLQEEMHQWEQAERKMDRIELIVVGGIVATAVGLGILNKLTKPKGKEPHPKPEPSSHWQQRLEDSIFASPAQRG